MLDSTFNKGSICNFFFGVIERGNIEENKLLK